MKTILYWLLWFPLCLHAEDELKIRAQFITSKAQLSSSNGVFEAVVGERVTLAVDVLTRTWFHKAPRFSHLNVRDAITLKADAFATNFSERIGADVYAVQRREYTIFPQRAGQFVINGVEVGAWLPDEPDGPLRKRVLRSKPLLMMIHTLPAVDDDELVQREVLKEEKATAFVADDVIMTQRFSSNSDQLRVGDVIERLIEIRATGTLGMLIPSLTWPDIDEAKQVSLSPLIEDKNNRGEFVGIRLETRQYTLTYSGELELPAITLWWWDGDSWQKSQVAGKTLKNIEGRGEARSTVFLDAFSPGAILQWSVWLSISLAFGWFFGLMVRRSETACRAVYTTEFWRLFSLRLALWYRSPQRVVALYYHWRNASKQPLRALPESLESVWAEWCVMAQNRVRPSFIQRRQLWSLVHVMKRESTPIINCDRDRASISAAIPLQPLNPQ